MSEYQKALTIVKDPRLDEPNDLQNPLLTKEFIYQFLNDSHAYHATEGKVEITPELQKQYDLAFPGLSIKDKFQPNNLGWYQSRLKNKVLRQERLFSEKDDGTVNENILSIRQQRALNLMALVHSILIKNDIAEEQAQEISFNTVNKALDKNPNLTFSNELDVKESPEIVESLAPEIEKKLKPIPKNEDTNKKELDESNAKELHHFMINQMMYEFKAYEFSRSFTESLGNPGSYRDFAHMEVLDKSSNVSLALKNNVKAMRAEFREANITDNTQRKSNLPTPFDDLMDPYSTRK